MTTERPLSSLFKSEEIQPVDFRQILFTGFLTKEGGSWKSWRRRYFVLTVDGVLTYYEDETMTKPKGSLSCKDSEVQPLRDLGDLYFEIATDLFKSHDAGTGRKMKLLAENEKNLADWVQAIRAVSCLYGDGKAAAAPTEQGSVDDMEPLC
jgi:hypothetical protein